MCTQQCRKAVPVISHDIINRVRTFHEKLCSTACDERCNQLSHPHSSQPWTVCSSNKVVLAGGITRTIIRETKGSKTRKKSTLAETHGARVKVLPLPLCVCVLRFARVGVGCLSSPVNLWTSLATLERRRRDRGTGQDRHSTTRRRWLQVWIFQITCIVHSRNISRLWDTILHYMCFWSI